MKLVNTAAAVLLISCVVAESAWADFSGQVVGVSDGDTLTVMDGGKGRKVRLNEIDAPESSQDFGQASKKSLSDLCFGKQAVIQDQGQDRYSRTLGRVSCAGVDVNAEQVRRGLAWFYVQYGKDTSIQALEKTARESRTGLWAKANPTPPWDYRHGGKSKPSPAVVASTPSVELSGDCGGKSACGQMSSCAEAKHYLQDCGLTKLDRDRDGIPCESLCR